MFKIEIIKKNKKNASAIIKDGIIKIYLPNKINKSKEEEIIRELLRKVTKKLDKSELPFKEVVNKRKFIFSNETYKIEFYKYNRYKFENNKFYFPYKSNLNNVRRFIIKELTLKFEERVKELVNVINKETLNVKYNKIYLKVFNSKYGHCTFDNEIAINLKLLNAPFEVLRYIIVHELAHVIEKNHSKRFWKLVSKYVPNYKTIKKYLRENPPRLFLLD